MNKILLFMLLSISPLLGFAKQCPTCLKTYQSQTIRGQTQLIYRWMVRTMNPNNSINYSDFTHLFAKNTTITINGKKIADGIPGVYRYFVSQRREQPILNAKLRALFVDQHHATLQYQTITQRKGQKYRSLIIAILHFKGRKLQDWHAVSHTTHIR